jgi:hypothetical protein
MRPIDPITITTTDGEERKLLLSFGGIRRLKQRLGVKTLGEILELDAEACGVPILYESLLVKGTLTEEQFADLLPADVGGMMKAIARLLGASLPEQDDRPIDAGTPPTV